jgi:hypothetical protein
MSSAPSGAISHTSTNIFATSDAKCSDICNRQVQISSPTDRDQPMPGSQGKSPIGFGGSLRGQHRYSEPEPAWTPAIVAIPGAGSGGELGSRQATPDGSYWNGKVPLVKHQRRHLIANA